MMSTKPPGNRLRSSQRTLYVSLAVCLCFGPIVAGRAARPVAAQTRAVSVGILEFQDESGANAKARLGFIASQGLQRILATAGVSIKPIRPGTATSAQDLTQAQLTDLGRGAGVQFLIRGALSAVAFEKTGGTITVTVQAYADVIAVDTAVASRVTSEGSARLQATDADALPGLAAIDPGSAEFNGTVFGRAFRRANADAISRLVDAVRQALSGQPTQPPAADQTQPVSAETPQPATPEPQTASEPDSGQSAAAKEAESDEELQQLLAQAAESLASNPALSPERREALRQTLERLLGALNEKAQLMESASTTGTEQADQQVDAQQSALETAVAQIPPPDPGVADPGQPAAAGGGIVERIGNILNLAFATLQKIQEVRSAFRRVQEDAVTETPPPSAAQPATSDQPPAETPPPEETLGEISGAVTEDGQPVAGAVVTNPESGASTTTTADGSFTLSGVAPRLLNLTVIRNGVRLAQGQLHVLRGRTTTADFQVRSPANRGTQLPALRILPATVAVRSQATGEKGTVKGIVRDAAGRPVARTLVNLRGLGVARTDSHGQYVFTGVPAGSHQVTVFKSGLPPSISRVQVEARKTSAAASQLAGDSLRARPIGVPVLALHASAAETATLRGVVTDTQNRPLAGGRVSLAGAASAVTVRTNTAGSFELRGVRPGSYRVLAARVGYDDAIQAVTLRAGGVEQLKLRLSSGSSAVTRRILEDPRNQLGEIHGQVRSANQALVARASVEVRSLSRAVPNIKTLTNAKGECSFKALPGRYELRVAAGNLLPITRIVTVQPREIARFDVTLTAKVTAAPVPESPGRPAPPSVRPAVPESRSTPDRIAPSGIPPRTAPLTGVSPSPVTRVVPDRATAIAGQLTGRITDGKTGRSLAGAVVTIQGHAPETTDTEGSYTLANLAPGEYLVSAVRSGYARKQRTVRVTGAAAVVASFTLDALAIGLPGAPLSPAGRLTPPADRTVTPSPPKIGEVSLRVVDKTTNRPIGGARITIPGQRGLSTDSSGSCSLTLPEGSYRVGVTKPGYGTAFISVVVRAGQTATGTVKLATTPTAPR
jgi:hypothetical protein